MEDDFVQAVLNSTKGLTADVIGLHARVDALVALFLRYAEQLGSSGAQIREEYEKLYEAALERRLLAAEKHDPASAAHLDRRKIEGLAEDSA